MKKHIHDKAALHDKLETLGATIVCLLLLAAVFGLNALGGSSKHHDAKDKSEAVVQDEAQLVEGRYLFSGTVVLARAVERDAAGDFTQPFSMLDTFAPERYDEWMVDLECPVTDQVISYQRQVSNLLFNCNTGWLTEFSKHFSIASLANNHTNDLGAAGFAKTLESLQGAGVKTVGAPDPADTDQTCRVLPLKVRVVKTKNKQESAVMPVAFCAYHYFGRAPLAGEFDIVKRYADIMPVFAFMHAGEEYRSSSDQRQQQVARALIDNGAEFVIGNSPHWVQESEVYKGKPIFYSTGNFIFDQIGEEEQRGLSIDLSLSVDYKGAAKQWIDFAQECADNGQLCFDAARIKGLSKPSLDLYFQPVASQGGVRQVTRVANSDTQLAVEDRLNWLLTKQLLGQ